MSLQVGFVKIGAFVLLEKKRNNVSIDYEHYSMLRIWEARRRSRTLRTKSSTLSSLGQKSARNVSRLLIGFKSCSAASRSNSFLASSGVIGSSTAVGFLCVIFTPQMKHTRHSSI